MLMLNLIYTCTCTHLNISLQVLLKRRFFDSPLQLVINLQICCQLLHFTLRFKNKTFSTNTDVKINVSGFVSFCFLPWGRSQQPETFLSVDFSLVRVASAALQQKNTNSGWISPGNTNLWSSFRRLFRICYVYLAAYKVSLLYMHGFHFFSTKCKKLNCKAISESLCM